MSHSALARRVAAVEAREPLIDRAWMDRLTDAERERLESLLSALMPSGKELADLSETEQAELNARWAALGADDLAFLEYVTGVRDGTIEPAG